MQDFDTVDGSEALVDSVVAVDSDKLVCIVLLLPAEYMLFLYSDYQYC